MIPCADILLALAFAGADLHPTTRSVEDLLLDIHIETATAGVSITSADPDRLPGDAGYARLVEPGAYECADKWICPDLGGVVTSCYCPAREVTP